MKKLVSLLIALMMLFSTIALAAEIVDMQQYPLTEEKIELTMMAPKNALDGNWEDLWFFKHMEELTNIHWNFNTVASDSFQEKKNLMFAGADLPDLFYGGGLSKSDEVTYGSQGLLIPLNDLIKTCMPNFMAACEIWPELWNECVTLDGNIYALPKIWQTPHGTTTKYFINTVWLDTLGLEMPTTLDEFYEVLCAFRDHPELSKNGDMIPFGGRNAAGSQIDTLVLSAYGLLGGSQEQGFSLYELVDGKVELAAALPQYKEVLTYIKKLYDEGLIDSEYFTQTSEQFTAKGANMQYGVFSAAANYVVPSLDDAADYALMAPLTLSKDDTKIWPRTSGISNGMAAITVTNPHPEETARWLDYCFSTEGANLEVCGPEGMLWHWDENGKFWTAEEEKFAAEGLGWSAYKHAYVSADVAPLAVDTTLFYDLEKLPVVKQIYYDSTHVQLEPYFRSIYPNMYYTDEETMDIASLTADIESYLKTSKAKFIIGDLSLDNFETDYLSTLEKMNLSRLLTIQQTAYDRYLANLG